MTTPIGKGPMPLPGFEPKSNRQEDIREAAVQFESFFLRRMLAEVRGSSEGGLLDQGPGAKMFKEMLDERLADSMADGGGIGIADMVAKQLSAQLGVDVDDAPSAGGFESRREGATAASGAVEASARAPGVARAAYGRAPGRLSALPIEGMPLTSRFGRRTDPIDGGTRFHGGVDVGAPTGTAVKAAGPGVVVRAGFAGGYGNLVVIDHGDGLQTRYAHLDSFDVDVGDRVPAGARIGEVGETGRATGPHLHFEVRRDGKAVNPANEIFPLK